jgi:hypothetical protein
MTQPDETTTRAHLADLSDQLTEALQSDNPRRNARTVRDQLDILAGRTNHSEPLPPDPNLTGWRNVRAILAGALGADPRITDAMTVPQLAQQVSGMVTALRLAADQSARLLDRRDAERSGTALARADSTDDLDTLHTDDQGRIVIHDRQGGSEFAELRAALKEHDREVIADVNAELPRTADHPFVSAYKQGRPDRCAYARSRTDASTPCWRTRDDHPDIAYRQHPDGDNEGNPT